MQNIAALAVLLSALLLTPMAFLLTPSASGQAVDGSGSAVDFNGDGYSDLAIGVPNEGINGQAEAGMVNIIYGSAAGLSATTVPDDVIVGNNRLGGARALASGDFNGDGYSDLAMGQPFYDASPVFFEFHLIGAVTALYGSATVLGDEQVWHRDVANVEDVAEDDEMFGAAVSAGWG